MLQIISGKFFKSDDRNVFDGRGIAYSNFSWVAPITTCVATLEPVDTATPISSYVISYRNQLEREDRTGTALLVRTGDAEICEQFRLLCAFGLNAFFSEDRGLVAANCRQRPENRLDPSHPARFIPRVFDSQLWGTAEETMGFVDLVHKVIDLPRESYKSLVRSLSYFAHALTTLGHNVDLPYTLLVYSLESLAKTTSATLPNGTITRKETGIGWTHCSLTSTPTLRRTLGRSCWPVTE